MDELEMVKRVERIGKWTIGIVTGIFIGLLVVLLFGCSNAYAENNPGRTIQKTMEVPYNEPELSSITKVINNTAYVQIIKVLDGSDEIKLWADIQIIKENYPDVNKYVVYLDCYGGVAKSGFAIGDMLGSLQDKYKVEIRASGIVASAAVMIFLAVENRYAEPNTLFMVHELAYDPSSMTASKLDFSDVQSMKRMFELLTDRYVDILCKNSKLMRTQWVEKMKDTTYFWTQDALEWGMIKEMK